MNNAVAATMLSGVFRQYSRRTCPAIRARACPKTLAYCEVVLRATNERLGKLKIAKLFFLFLAAFSPHTTTSRNVNGFQTCSRGESSGTITTIWSNNSIPAISADVRAGELSNSGYVTDAANGEYSPEKIGSRTETTTASFLR